MINEYVELEVKESTWRDIATSLRHAGYDHAFLEEGVINMHGLMIKIEKVKDEQ